MLASSPRASQIDVLDDTNGVEMELVAHIEGLREPGPLGRIFRSAKVFDSEVRPLDITGRDFMMLTTI